MKHERVFSGMCGALLAAVAAAQEPAPAPAVRLEAYMPAEPVNRAPPTYPGNALIQGREGWALVSFIISETGEVIEPMIEDSSHPDFDRPSLRAIERWRYKPATVDGKPVEQSMVQTMIRYQIEDAKGATPQFVKKYRQLYDLILAKNLTEAAPLLQTLEEGRLNFYEEAWLWWIKYVYLEATGTAEPAALEEALRKALGSSEIASDEYLQPDVYVAASERLFAVRARSGDFSGALAAFERLEASEPAKRSKRYGEAMTALQPIRREILDLVNGPNILQQKARIQENDYWVHRMLRRSFAVGDVQGGKLAVVDLRCKRANRRFVALPPDAVLKIPDSWGDCGVYIKGDVGTAFVFEEYPAGYSNAVEAAPTATPGP
ncbi:MAG TPA: energy transducer TonB [Gammaproteobacteria bacterium]|nr:energy transducer TonB [Gammaproteobacteria bacterium]